MKVVGFFNRFSAHSALRNGDALPSPMWEPVTDPGTLASDSFIWALCSTFFWESFNCILCLSSCFCFSYSFFLHNLLPSSVSTLPEGPFNLLPGTTGMDVFCCLEGKPWFIYASFLAPLSPSTLLSLLWLGGGGGGDDGGGGALKLGGDEGGGGGCDGCEDWLLNWEYWEEG